MDCLKINGKGGGEGKGMEDGTFVKRGWVTKF